MARADDLVCVGSSPLNGAGSAAALPWMESPRGASTQMGGLDAS